MSDAALLQTPLHDLHLRLGARMVPFAGYAMPVQYPSRPDCRTQAVPRIGRSVRRFAHGPGQAGRQRRRGRPGTLVPVDVVDLGVGKQRYAFFTNATGGLLDDLMIVRPMPGSASATCSWSSTPAARRPTFAT
jgi:aminomethyltransferase